MTQQSDRAKECRSAAAEIRVAAETIKDGESRTSLLKMAVGYERLASRLEAESGPAATSDAPVSAAGQEGKDER